MEKEAAAAAAAAATATTTAEQMEAEDSVRRRTGALMTVNDDMGTCVVYTIEERRDKLVS